MVMVLVPDAHMEALVRTHQEIRDKIRELRSSQDDFLGFKVEVLISFLDFDHAKEFLREDADAASWNADVLSLTEDEAVEAMADYAAFAWTKVLNHRGISAARNIDKMWAYAYVMDIDHLTKEITERLDEDYAPYGAPILAYVCRQMGFPIPEDDAIQRMIDGKACSQWCMECLG